MGKLQNGLRIKGHQRGRLLGIDSSATTRALPSSADFSSGRLSKKYCTLLTAMKKTQYCNTPPLRHSGFLIRIVSGGQTGADRAALDWALAHNVPCGGWCPNGRKAADGPIDPKYPLKERPSASYLQRTEWNVRDSDATVLFSIEPALTGGSLKTVDFARKHKKPNLHLCAREGLQIN